MPLLSLLKAVHQQRATGVARTESPVGDADEGTVLIFRSGYLIYAGHTVPSPSEFVYEVARHKEIGVIDTVMEFAQKRSSVRAVAQAMVGLVLQWEDIYQAMYQQATVVMERALCWSGGFIFESGQSEFDLQYSGSNGFAIPTLLAEVREQRSQLHPPEEVSNDRDPRPAILSVDDSPVAQALIQRALGKDYRIESCGAAHEALAALLERQNDYALLLLDLTLPDMDGLEFCHWVRKYERFKDLPIVMLTARDGMVDRFRGRVAGTNHYLTKPVPVDKLRAVCKQFVRVPA
ncbi:MAG: response regulator [Cyanobacteria bacterium J06641_5]